MCDLFFILLMPLTLKTVLCLYWGVCRDAFCFFLRYIYAVYLFKFTNFFAPLCRSWLWKRRRVLTTGGLVLRGSYFWERIKPRIFPGRGRGSKPSIIFRCSLQIHIKNVFGKLFSSWDSCLYQFCRTVSVLVISLQELMVLSAENRCYPHFFLICQTNLLVWNHKVAVPPFWSDVKLCGLFVRENWNVGSEQGTQQWIFVKPGKPILG